MKGTTASIERVDTNLFELIGYTAAKTGRHCHEGQSYSYASFAPSAWINAVFALNLEGLGGAKELARLIASGTLPNRVMLGPTSRPVNIGALLTSAGFVSRPSARGMMLDMAKRRSLCAPEGAVLRFLGPEDGLTEWAAVVAENLFDVPRDSGGTSFAELIAAIEGPRTFSTGLFTNNVLVSTCFGFIDSEGVGGIYFVATEKIHRRKGYGAAVVSATLEELAARGVETCILHASALGEPVYESLGFVGVCDLGRYALGEAASTGVR